MKSPEEMTKKELIEQLLIDTRLDEISKLAIWALNTFDANIPRHTIAIYVAQRIQEILKQ